MEKSREIFEKTQERYKTIKTQLQDKDDEIYTLTTRLHKYESEISKLRT